MTQSGDLNLSGKPEFTDSSFLSRQLLAVF